MGGAILRRYRPEDAAALTELLHRAYAELGRRGWNFTAVDQDEATTAYRAGAGRCWVLAEDDQLLATAALSTPPSSAVAALTGEARVPDRAWLNQLAVDPSRRGTGLGRRLWEAVLDAAESAGATSIGVDTARPAEHLLRLYRGWGFAQVDEVQWTGKTYRSAVMVRALVPSAPPLTPPC